MKEEDLTEKQEELLGKDWKSKQEALDLIEKVGKLREVVEEEVEEIELNPVIKSTVEKYQSEASKRDIKITAEECDTDVKGGSFLNELFSNLIVNLIVHSEGDVIRLRVTQSEGKAIVTVEDDGRGIPDGDKENIFEKGYRKGKSAGSGLGMYLVREIADSYGGSVEVKDSELGGARFDVYLKKA